MTEENQNRKKVLEQISYLDRLAILGNASKTAGISQEANGKLEELLKTYSTEFVPIGRDKPYADGAPYDPQTAEEVSKDIQQGLSKAAYLLRKEPSSYKGAKNLENMASQEVILNNVEAKDQQNALDYARYLEIKGIGEEASKGEIKFGEKDEGKRKFVSQLVMSGIMSEERDRLLKLGLSIESASIGATLHAHYKAAKGINHKENIEYVKKGAKDQMSRIEKGIKLPENTNLRDYMVGVVGKAMEKVLTKSQDHKMMEDVARAFYEASEGYQIGGRKYSEAYKKAN